MKGEGPIAFSAGISPPNFSPLDLVLVAAVDRYEGNGFSGLGSASNSLDYPIDCVRSLGKRSLGAFPLRDLIRSR